MEEWLCDRILFAFKSEINDLNTGLEEVFGTKINTKADGLDKIFEDDPQEGEKP